MTKDEHIAGAGSIHENGVGGIDLYHISTARSLLTSD